VLVHVQDLPFHGKEEEGDEVEKEDGPEHRNVEHLEKGHEKGGTHGARTAGPKLKLRKAAAEWPKLFGVAHGQAWAFLVRIDLRGKEANEVVQEVDAETVGYNVPAVNGENSKHIEPHENDEKYPPSSDMRCGPVHPYLGSPSKLRLKYFQS